MESSQQRNHRELTALKAVAETLRQLPTPGGKGKYLIAYGQDNNWFQKYLRLIYDPWRWWALRSCLVTTGSYQDFGDGPTVPRLLRDVAALPYPQDSVMWASFCLQQKPDVRPVLGGILDRNLFGLLPGVFVDRVLTALREPPIDAAKMYCEMGYCNLSQPFASAELCGGEALRRGIAIPTAAIRDVARWLKVCGVGMDEGWQSYLKD